MRYLSIKVGNFLSDSMNDIKRTAIKIQRNWGGNEDVSLVLKLEVNFFF